MPTTQLAPAKINLALHITGQRADGYHLLHSLIAFADCGDRVTLARANQDGLTVEGAFASKVPPLESNTLGAALAMVRNWGRDDRAREPAHIRLAKDLPLAAGVGGGSADAATLISLLTGGRALTSDEMEDCLKLGADVPMCLIGRPAIIGGIGEENSPVSLPQAHLVLANPGVESATPAVFKALTQKTNPPLPAWPAPSSFADLVGYLHTTRNDLIIPARAIAPPIRACLEALSDSPFASMSGSGATCFALLETAHAAHELAARIGAQHPDWWVRQGKLRS